MAKKIISKSPSLTPNRQSKAANTIKPTQGQKPNRANPNTGIQEITKYQTYLEADEAKVFFDYSKDKKWIDRLIFTMFKWWDENKGETVEDFCHEYKIHRQQLWALADEDAEFKKYYTTFKQLMANNDIKGAKHKDWDRETVMLYIHSLDDKYKDMHAYHAELKKKEEANKGGDKEYILVEKPREYPLPEEKKDGS